MYHMHYALSDPEVLGCIVMFTAIRKGKVQYLVTSYRIPKQMPLQDYHNFPHVKY